MPTALENGLRRVAALLTCDAATDGELLGRYVDLRDEAAFVALVQRHGAMVSRTCRRVLGNATDADDASQVTFVVLLRQARALTDRPCVGNYLYGLAYHTALKAKAMAAKRRAKEANAKRVAIRERDELLDILDEELVRLPEMYRGPVVLCELEGRSRREAARALGLPEGTISSRLATAHRMLRERVGARGVAGVCLAALFAGESSAGSVARVTAEAVLLPTRTVSQLAAEVTKMKLIQKVGLGLVGVLLTGGGLMLAGGPGDPPAPKVTPPAANAPEPKVVPVTWKEKAALPLPGALAVSIAYSADGKRLVVGDTNGKVSVFDPSAGKLRWETAAGGSHPAVAYSADGKTVYATTKNGVQFLDAETGKAGETLEVKDCDAVAIGVFPDRDVETHTTSKIILGTARGYVVKNWFAGKLPTAGGIEVATAAKGQGPAVPNAVPLAVDPKGWSAISAGPRDPKTGRNVLWAYVCGDHGPGSPGNRVLEGHEAAVVAAAWSGDGGSAATGDADGRVIVWDAKTMKEVRRVELGGRVGALALTPDGKRTAATVVGEKAEVYVWSTAKPTNTMRPIHTGSGTSDTAMIAGLAFSADGRQLAGFATDKVWLSRPGVLIGQVNVWEDK
jgi:RNA polymerase sigma factor (sigma-70 family)